MTEKEIRKMEPGRELDELVAKIIMKAPNDDYFFTNWGKGPFKHDMDGNEVTWNPSKRIQDAWEVAEKINVDYRWDITITTAINAWEVSYYWDHTRPIKKVIDSTISVAICKAALLVVLNL